MSALFFTTESFHPTTDRILACYKHFEKHMKLENMNKYCDMLDTIAIIPFCQPKDCLELWKERRFVSWKRREADIRLYMNYEVFRKATFEEQQILVKDVIIRSLEVVKQRCEAKKYRFDLEAIMNDLFSEE